MNRREFCNKAAVGAIGALIGGSGGASASRVSPDRQSRPETETVDTHDGTVSTRDHYYVTWYDAIRRKEGVGEYEYDIADPVPGYDSPDSPEEIVVFAHGWQVNSWVADVNFTVLADTLQANGYEHPVVGYKWDSDTDVLDWWEAIDLAKLNAKKLGRFIVDYKRQNPDTKVRLMGHSLGTQVVLSTVRKLDEWDWGSTLDSLTLLGAAVDDEVVATGEPYGGPIARQTDQTDNFHSAHDTVLKTGYSAAEWDYALGNYGAEGTTPDNYQDQNVDYVLTHLNYFLVGLGCLDEVVREWTGEPPENGDASRQIAGSISTSGGSATHTYRAPAADGLRVTLHGPADADFDLYVTLDGRTPTPSDYDRASTTDERTESVTIDGATLDGEATLGLLVDGYAGTGDYTVVVHPAV